MNSRLSDRIKRFTAQPAMTWLFYAGLFLLLIADYLYARTDLTPAAASGILRVCGIVGQGLLALRLLTLLPRYPKYVLVSICILAALRYSYFLSGPKTLNLFHLGLAVAASREADVRTALKIYLAYLLLWFIACPASYAAGVTGNVTTSLGQMQGYSAGFINPNMLAVFIMTTIFLLLYLTREKRPAVVCAVCWAAGALTFFLTLSLTQTFLLLLLPAAYMLMSRKAPAPWMLAALPVACLAVSAALAWLYGPGYGSDSFESRFSIPALVYAKYGLSLFGQNCGLSKWFGDVFPYDLPIDNAYLNLLICSGVATCVVAMAFLCRLMLLIGRRRDTMLTVIACCIVIAGMMEHIPLSIRMSFLPLLYIPLAENSLND